MSISRVPSRRAVGLRRIAEELDVSVSLVSKVLSGRMGTSGANQAKVQAIHKKAEELDYRKNLLAESLRTGQQNVLAVCIHQHGEPGSSIVEEMVAGIAAEASVHHQRLLLHYYRTAQEFLDFVPNLHASATDGVIIGGIGHPELVDMLKTIRERGLPLVSIHDTQLDAAIPNIGMDQKEVGRRATSYLIEQGCRHIAHFHTIDPPAAVYSLGENRFQGYRAALQQAGIPYSPDLVIPVEGFGYEAGVSAVERLIASGTTFDGIFGQSDHHVAAALNAFMARGIQVPEQVKLIGVDNAPFCSLAAVALSSVSQEFAVRGRRAVQVLMALRNAQGVPTSRFDPVVYPRASSF